MEAAKSKLRNYLYFLSLVSPSLVIAGNFAGSWFVATNFIFSFFVMAVLEQLIGDNTDNAEGEENNVPQFILYLHVVFQAACIASLFYSVQYNQLNTWQIVLAAVSTGVNSGSSAIVVAHDLIHNKSEFKRACGKFLLFTSFNIYFYIDHLRVHHKWVGTEKDPATAKLGESVYAFFWRSMTGQIASSLNVEKARLEKENKSSWSFNNYVIRNAMLQLLFIALLFSINKYLGIAYLIQGFLATFLLEYINYIEHYGLSRDEKTRVNETHSWQSDKVVSRFLLIDLSRHSDHHYYASKSFHTLKSYERSPVLPGGYISLFYLAAIPVIWFKVVHRILDEYHVSQQNINIK